MKLNIGLTGLLFIVFLTLKLAGAIGWSWWWVTAPLWIPVFFFVGFVIVLLFVLLLVWLVTLAAEKLT